MYKNFEFEIIITHGGVFHADDVFCVAMAKVLNPHIKYERVPVVGEEPLPSSTIIVDIGGGEFDHHQEAKARNDGNPYSSFGLMWAAFGRILCPSNKAWEEVEQDLVIPIDLQDNGVQWNPLSKMVKAMNPLWNEDSSKSAQDAAFERAVQFALDILKRFIEKANSSSAAEEEVLAAAENARDGIVFLPRFVPFQECLSHQEKARYVVYPSLRGGYNLQPLHRQLLPEEWLTRKPEGVSFVHKARFLACIETKERAIELAKALL